ncbi:hypothetical protein ANABIO32_14100 [Rossellomorea marisflavi]|nr:hypothetical protein ANABIO32_14100 [Rossellomorea marisflavi]
MSKILERKSTWSYTDSHTPWQCRNDIKNLSKNLESQKRSEYTMFIRSKLVKVKQDLNYI